MATKKSQASVKTTITKTFKDSTNSSSATKSCNMCRGTGKIPKKKKG